MAPSGIETATFRLVAQFLSQMRYGVPYICYSKKRNLIRGIERILFYFCCSYSDVGVRFAEEIQQICNDQI